MTKAEFDKLKVGNAVYLPDKQNKTFIGTEVTAIDRYFNKLDVLLGKKFYSYKYISRKYRLSRFMVGMCPPSWIDNYK